VSGRLPSRLLRRCGARRRAQRRLQREGVGRVRLKPHVDFGGPGQNDGHRFRVDERDNGVGLSRQKAEQLVIALNRRAFGTRTPRQGVHRPASEQQTILAQREPRRRLARLRVLVLAERCRRHNAASVLVQPRPPVRAAHVADVRDRLATKLRRAGHAPARQNELTVAVPSDSDDGRELVGEDRGEKRQIARAVVRAVPTIRSRRS
jgi:hypothetical protein